MNLFDLFANAVPMAEFLARSGNPGHAARWQATFDDVMLTNPQRELLAKFTRRTNVLVLAGAWCGDCARNCPIFARFAEAAPVLDVRFIDRDEHADVQSELQVNGGDRIPIAVFFSEDGHEVARYGDRTLSAYRALVQQQVGTSCGTELAAPGDPLLMRIAQDWLDQFERAQWILRLSPRLRKLHGD